MNTTINKWIHLLVWAIYGLILGLANTHSSSLGEVVGKTLILVTLHAGIFYANALVLMPRYFDKKKYLPYALGILLIIAASFAVFFLLHSLYPPPGHGPESHRVPLNPFRFFLKVSMFNVFSSFSILALSLLWYNYQEKNREEKRSLALKGQNLEADLSQLRAQINPHFLFNALNNIYSLSLSHSENTSDAIFSLSQMMRYVLFESSAKFVPLEKEVSYLNNFIAMQKLKDDSLDNIFFDAVDLEPGLKIAPMLLIPFVENCFKHGNYTQGDPAFIRIRLSGTGKSIEFSCENTLGEQVTVHDEVGGIGIENVIKRLKLIYGDKADLIINQNEGRFLVILKIRP
ncbi:MAG: histidine kinase [Bacteroidia bacterium]|nr:histidine kinase [Bacteroidia bacterium]